MTDYPPVLGHVLLNELVAFVRRFVVLNDAQSAAVALWIVHTHAIEACEQSPLLAITSPEKRSGKTRLLDVLELLAAKPWRVITPSEAVVFRKIHADQPTLLLDEVDAIFNPKSNGATEGLRALLNAGNRPGTMVPRCVGPSQSLVSFSVFCAKALAGIRELPDTVADRAIPIRMKRKTPGEQVERFRRRDVELAAGRLREWARSWAEHRVPQLTEARPQLPNELNDRAQDAWEPLLAIADLAGHDWPARARAAAVALSADDDDESAGIRLLADVRDVLDARELDRISSADLVEALHEIEEAPWGEWYGRPITVHGIARLLAHYDVRPRTVRFENETAKGYRRDQFEEAWSRYLAQENRHNVTTRMDSRIATDSEASHVTDENGPDPAWGNGCDVVTDENANKRHEHEYDLLQEDLDHYYRETASGDGHEELSSLADDELERLADVARAAVDEYEIA